MASPNATAVKARVLAFTMTASEWQNQKTPVNPLDQLTAGQELTQINATMAAKPVMPGRGCRLKVLPSVFREGGDAQWQERRSASCSSKSRRCAAKRLPLDMPRRCEPSENSRLALQRMPDLLEPADPRA